MTLSFETIFKPLNDFFLNKFGSTESTGVVFRFDKIGSVLTDSDFTDPLHPEQGVSSALAVEKFSDLVNRVPIECDDGLNVLLTQGSIDDSYFYRMLKPAVPRPPAGADAAAVQSVSDAFFTKKNQALLQWNNVTMESLIGVPMQYKPSLATPPSWYDGTKADAWTSQTFTITPPIDAAPSPTSTPTDGLWRMQPSVSTLSALVREPDASEETADQVPRAHLEANIQSLRNVLMAAPVRATDTIEKRDIATLRMAITPREAGTRNLIRPLEVPAASPAPEVSGPLLRDHLAEQTGMLEIRDRLLLNSVIAAHAETVPAKTRGIVVSFDYCVVNVGRPWLFDVFLDSDDWMVPGVEAGVLSSPATAGGLPALPIGMVAIRNLVITADWNADDVAASQDATAFGPFKIDGGIANGAIRHSSIQSIGWLLQRLPALPPTSATTSPPASTGT